MIPTCSDCQGSWACRCDSCMPSPPSQPAQAWPRPLACTRCAPHLCRAASTSPAARLLISAPVPRSPPQVAPRPELPVGRQHGAAGGAGPDDVAGAPPPQGGAHHPGPAGALLGGWLAAVRWKSSWPARLWRFVGSAHMQPALTLFRACLALSPSIQLIFVSDLPPLHRRC